jgi:hypothetical protein
LRHCRSYNEAARLSYRFNDGRFWCWSDWSFDDCWRLKRELLFDGSIFDDRLFEMGIFYASREQGEL